MMLIADDAELDAAMVFLCFTSEEYLLLDLELPLETALVTKP